MRLSPSRSMADRTATVLLARAITAWWCLLPSLRYVVHDPVVDQATNVLFGVAMAPIPIAAGIAILRYRLYEIDLEGDAQRIELARV